MDKYEYIVNLAEKTAKRVSQNRESWMKFLTSAARIYKYPFKEQLLIYAQNPDATACASIEIWNKRMNCWVNKGSSGIALPDDTATYGHKLKYVFDVSNVHAVKPNGRYPKAWKLREEHKSDVLHRLEQIYGSTDSTKPFEERIIEISDQLAADAYTELQIDYPDLQDRIGFDKLSEQDFALCLKKLISESVSFTILSACEIEISDHEFSFDYINHLDVPWRPSDIEQQEGRILRQGNRNRKVKIFRYVTEGTFDAYSWQLIENKQKFISQIMTSKSPVRSCEDVDESALSYAEVKALATGNPYIKEKMDLDIQVSRLRLLKANYTSQKYRMEDNIVQHYPRQIVMVKELIEKLEQDIALYEQNAATSKDKFHMQVGSGVYDTRKDAGNAIIKFFQTDADGTAKIGTYLGFSMNIAFDSFNRKFVLRLKGAMNHPVEIGPDPVGNIIRLDNVLKTMPDKLAEAKDRLETLTNQLESAKIEVTKPFQQEEELAEKLKRLAELNALLNMDEKGTDALILEDDEQPAIVNSDMAVTPITSVKTKPMLKKKVVGLCL